MKLDHQLLGIYSLRVSAVLVFIYIYVFFVSFSGHQTTSEEVLSEPWFLALLGSVVLTVLILIFVGIILYRKQWSRQKGLGQLSLPGIITARIFRDVHKILRNLHRIFVL